jgi:hypothetical protein
MWTEQPAINACKGTAIHWACTSQPTPVIRPAVLEPCGPRKLGRATSVEFTCLPLGRLATYDDFIDRAQAVSELNSSVLRKKFCLTCHRFGNLIDMILFSAFCRTEVPIDLLGMVQQDTTLLCNWCSAKSPDLGPKMVAEALPVTTSIPWHR